MKVINRENMANICKSLDQLSSQGNWDDVFYCLNIDANSTIELGSLKIPLEHNDMWLDDHKSTLNSLEVILGFILLCDQIFYIVLLVYLALIAYKFVRYHVFGALQQWCENNKFYFKKYRKINLNNNNCNVKDQIQNIK